MFKKISNLGTVLCKSELQDINGGFHVHGMCNNGTHFSYSVEGNHYATYSFIQEYQCNGSGIAYSSIRG